jgi:FdhD protein
MRSAALERPPSRSRVDGRVVVAPVFRRSGEASDLVAVEEPLELRIGGDVVGVLMRTPGEDHRLALGFLFSERIIESAADVSVVYHCGRPGSEGYGSSLEVTPASGARVDWARLDGARRSFSGGSACGACGRQAVSDLLEGLEPPPEGPVFEERAVSEAVASLRHHQPVFEVTGATHAAALWARDGALIAGHEDVGRHNAVDKVVGALLVAREEARHRGAPPPEPALLAVTSRAGLDVLQKAARARIPVVATVSAPTSLGVELACRAGLTLAAFVRDGRMNVYSGRERIRG